MKRRSMAVSTPWVPVLAVVLALFLAPSSSGAGAEASLRVTPGAGSYGGQKVTWSGNVGVPGVQQVHLQRRGNPTSGWAVVRDSTFQTAPDGSFSFEFPAPAMNGVYFRVVGDDGATPAYLFHAKHQDAELTIAEATPLPADVPLPRGFAVIGEPYRLAVDTTRGAAGETKPILAGREVTLQRRSPDGGEWSDEASTALGPDGLTSFGPYGPGAAPQKPGVYRVLLGDWTANGDRVGWFPSLPLHLNLVDRPRPVSHLAAVSLPSKVVLTWALLPDPNRGSVVIARRTGPSSPEPSAAQRWQIVATLPGTAARYVDLDVDPRRTYKYAVYTVSADGVYTAAEARLETSTPQGKES